METIPFDVGEEGKGALDILIAAALRPSGESTSGPTKHYSSLIVN